MSNPDTDSMVVADIWGSVLSESRQDSRKGPIAKPILTEILPTILNHGFGRNIIGFYRKFLNILL